MNGKDLKFGIEIECYVPKNARAWRVGGYHNGLQIRSCPNGWNGQQDTSLSSTKVHNGREYKAIEIVSPILKGLEGLAQIYYVVELLESAGAITDSKCGVHVHVDGRSVNGSVVSLKQEFKMFEDIFYGLCGQNARNRWNNFTYCKRSEFWSRFDNSERMRNLNLANLNRRKGTIEFRLFSAEINTSYLITAVYMSVAIVAQMSRTETTTHPIVRNRSRAERLMVFIDRFFGNSDNLIIEDEKTKDVEAFLSDRVRIASF